MMVNLMRSNQRWLMIVISVLVLISFLYYFSNSSRVERLGGERAGTIYGKSLSVTELQRADRQLNTAGELGLSHVYAPEFTQQVTLNDALVDQYVMIHQAEACGIFPSDEEADEAAQKLAAFRGPNGGFDANVKDAFIADKLNPRGFTESQVVELVKRDLQFARLRQLLDSTVVVTPTGSGVVRRLRMVSNGDHQDRCEGRDDALHGWGLPLVSRASSRTVVFPVASVNHDFF